MTKFLVLFIAMVFALPVFANQINVTRVGEYVPAHESEVLNFTALPDGGYLSTGISRTAKPPSFWMNRWQLDPDSLKVSAAKLPLSLPDHTFLVGGNRSGPLLEATEMRTDGEIKIQHPDWSQRQIWNEKRTSAKKIIYRLNSELNIKNKIVTKGIASLSQYCAIDVGDGFILSGPVTGPPLSDPRNRRNGNSRFSIPRVVKVDTAGNILWDKSFPQDENQALDVPAVSSLRGENCPLHLLKTREGNIIALFNVASIPLGGDGQTIKRDSDTGFHSVANHTLILQLNPKGKEIARTRVVGDNVHSAVFPVRSGYLLIESYSPDYTGLRNKKRFMPHAQAAGLGERMARSLGGLRIAELDFGLKVLRQSDLNVPSLNSMLLDVMPAKNGGFYILGCGVDTGVAIAFLDKEHKLSNVEHADPTPNSASCNAAGMAPTPDNSGVVFLVSDAETQLKDTEHKYVLYRAITQ